MPRRAASPVLGVVVVGVGVVLARLAGTLAGDDDSETLVPAAVLALLAVGTADVAVRATAPAGFVARARVVAGVVLLSIVVGSGVAARSGTGGDPSADIARNRAALDAIPPPPGSRRTFVADRPIFRGEEQQPSGFTTVVRYRAPDDLTADALVAFYDRALRGRWDREEIIAATAAAGPIATYRRGPARLSVNGDNLARHRFELAVETGR